MCLPWFACACRLPASSTCERCVHAGTDPLFDTRDRRAPPSPLSPAIPSAAAAAAAGPDARFKDEKELYTALRERYLLFVNCVESKPGAEPKAAFLYPQAPVTAGAHH